MNCSIGLCRFGAALTLAAAVAIGPARADLVLLGSDYLQTIQPTNFTPLGPLNPLAGLPIGPGTTDTIVQRQGNCSLILGTLGSSCTIPIEMVALSLISTVNPLLRVRESPTLASVGNMTMTSDGSGTGGTFASFFDVFIELSFDGGNTFIPQADLILQSSGTNWTTIEPSSPFLFVDGLAGDQNANRHTNKSSAACPVFGTGADCADFYLGGRDPPGGHGSGGGGGGGGGVGSGTGGGGSGGPGSGTGTDPNNNNGAACVFFGIFVDCVTECHISDPSSCHTAKPAQIAEPASLALVSLALAAMIGLGRRSRRRESVRVKHAPSEGSHPAVI